MPACGKQGTPISAQAEPPQGPRGTRRDQMVVLRRVNPPGPGSPDPGPTGTV